MHPAPSNADASLQFTHTPSKAVTHNAKNWSPLHRVHAALQSRSRHRTLSHSMQPAPYALVHEVQVPGLESVHAERYCDVVHTHPAPPTFLEQSRSLHALLGTFATPHAMRVCAFLTTAYVRRRTPIQVLVTVTRITSHLVSSRASNTRCWCSLCTRLHVRLYQDRHRSSCRNLLLSLSSRSRTGVLRKYRRVMCSRVTCRYFQCSWCSQFQRMSHNPYNQRSCKRGTNTRRPYSSCILSRI